MDINNYHGSFETAKSPTEAFYEVADVAAWWAKNFSGSARQIGDAFTVRFGLTSVDFEITAAIPGKSITWLVADCNLENFPDKKEWKGTRVVFNFSALPEGGTKVEMTHVGLHPGVACFEMCQNGWNRHFLGSLAQLLNEGIGIPA
jgi:hypothetical protein